MTFTDRSLENRSGKGERILQTVQSWIGETNPETAAEEDEALTALAADCERLNAEILAIYKAVLPAAVIHQIARGASEQAAIGRMMLDDCVLRAEEGKLTPSHLSNARKWNASVRRWIENRKAAYTTGCRRKLILVRSARAN